MDKPFASSLFLLPASLNLSSLCLTLRKVCVCVQYHEPGQEDYSSTLTTLTECGEPSREGKVQSDPEVVVLLRRQRRRGRDLAAGAGLVRGGPGGGGAGAGAGGRPEAGGSRGGDSGGGCRGGGEGGQAVRVKVRVGDGGGEEGRVLMEEGVRGGGERRREKGRRRKRKGKRSWRRRTSLFLLFLFQGPVQLGEELPVGGDGLHRLRQKREKSVMPPKNSQTSTHQSIPPYPLSSPLALPKSSPGPDRCRSAASCASSFRWEAKSTRWCCSNSPEAPPPPPPPPPPSPGRSLRPIPHAAF